MCSNHSYNSFQPHSFLFINPDIHTQAVQQQEIKSVPTDQTP